MASQDSIRVMYSGREASLGAAEAATAPDNTIMDNNRNFFMAKRMS
jgi:hypothetical protein